MAPKANAKPLVDIRERLGWPQVVMAQEMGLSLRAYQALEAGETPMRRIHQLAAERVALSTAWAQNRPDFIKGQIAREVIELAQNAYGLPMPSVGPDYLPVASSAPKA